MAGIAMARIMEDMSTKPDDNDLFFAHAKPAKLSISDLSDAPSTVLELMTFSPSIPETAISDEEPTVDMPKLRASTSEEQVASPSADGPTDAHSLVPNLPAKEPDLTLYFLQSSRSIRIAWLLEELGLGYKLVFFEREKNGAAPETFKAACGACMGKAPVLKDGDLILQESGAITLYLIQKYDSLQYLLPSSPALRAKALTYIHAAEGTFMLHGLLPYYAERADPSVSGAFLSALATDTGDDLDWLDRQIKEVGTRYLVDDTVTAADTMMAFGVQFLLKYGLHPAEKEGRWDNIRKWLKNVEASVCYQRAIAKTGHGLG